MEGDRQRSLHQEMAEFDVNALGPFRGSERVMLDTRKLAAQLSSLGAAADELIKVAPAMAGLCKVDDEA